MSFDKNIRKKIAKEEIRVPDAIHNKVEQTLYHLPELPEASQKAPVQFPICVVSHIVAIVACFLLVTFLIVPNVSVACAQALENIPVIGDIVRVITIRNYFYSDDKHEMNIDVPNIEEGASNSADLINQNINALTNALVEQFYQELESVGNNGYGSLYIDYEIVTNTDKWFTLKLRIHHDAGSSDTYFKYYHINKLTDSIVQLNDLAKNDSFYQILIEEIKRQMKEQMKYNGNKVYWLEDSIIGKDMVTIIKNHNFYWNEEGNIVIVFDKYEVAPGFMGTPEFIIDRNILQDFLKSEFMDIFSNNNETK